VIAILVAVFAFYVSVTYEQNVLASPQEVTLDPTFAPALTDGYTRVEAVAVQADGKILVGGNFPLVNGVARQAIARLNPDGSLDTSFNPPAISGVLDIVVQPDGKILAVGTAVYRLNTDGTPDPTFTPGTGPNYPIYDVLVLSTGKIIIAGIFTQYNGTAVQRIARLNADGTLDTSFTSPSVSSPIYEAAEQTDGKIIIVGTFSNIGGTPRRSVARLNADGSLDTSLDVGTFYSDRPSVAIQSDGKILVGGLMDENSNSLGMVRFAANGAIDPSFAAPYNPVISSTVHKIIILPDGSILAGGMAGLTGSSSPSDLYGVIKLTPTGALDNTFSHQRVVGDGLEVFSIALTPDGKIAACGDLYRLGLTNATSKRIALLDPNGAIVPSFAGSVEGNGLARDSVKQPDGKTIIVGRFHEVNGTPRPGIARFNAGGDLDPTFAPDLTNSTIITSVALQSDGKVLAIGSFLTIGGADYTLPIARFNSDGSFDAAFSAALQSSMASESIIGWNNGVGDLIVLDDGKILFSGYASDSSTGQWRSILRLNIDGTIDTTFVCKSNSYVYQIEPQPDGKLIIVGGFSAYDGVSRGRVARIDANGALDTSFNPGTGANSVIYGSALQPDGKIVLVGYFTTFNGGVANRIVRVNSDGSVDSGFNTGTGANASIDAMTVRPDGEIWIGGTFTDYNGQPVAYLGRLNPDGSLISSYSSQFNGPVGYVANSSDGGLIIGGTFRKYGQADRKGIAKLVQQTAPANSAPFDFDGDGKTDVSVYRPSNNVWYLQRSTDGFAAYQFGSASDKIVPADYTGDGKTDVAVYRPSSGTWYILRSEDFTVNIAPFGLSNDIPTPGDFDGDGKADLAVYRPDAQGTFYVLRSTEGFTAVAFGLAEDKPTSGDFDGDGKADIAVYRPSSGIWYRYNSSNGAFYAAQFGSTGDKLVPADYTGDGKTDIAIYRPSQGLWYVLRSEDGSAYGAPFGISTDIPAAGDYDGDGKADLAVFRPSDGIWYINKTSGGYSIIPFGSASDLPVPAAYTP